MDFCGISVLIVSRKNTIEYVCYGAVLRIIWCPSDLWAWWTTRVSGWQGHKLHQEARLFRIKVYLHTLCCIWYFKVSIIQCTHWPVAIICQNNHTDRHTRTHTHTHTHTRLTALCFFTEARDCEWQWNPLGHTQVCTSLQTDNHASTPLLSFLQAGCPSCRPTNSVKALKANMSE